MITYYGRQPAGTGNTTVTTAWTEILSLAQGAMQLTVEDNFGVYDLEIVNAGTRDLTDLEFRHAMDMVNYSAYPDISDVMAAVLVPLLAAGETLKLRLFVPIGILRIRAKSTAADGAVYIKYERVEISYNGPLANGESLAAMVVAGGGSAGDAFGQASMPYKSLFAETHEKGLLPLSFNTNTVNNGTLTHEDDLSAADLAVTATDTDAAHMQSKERFKFQLGSEMVFKFEFLMGAGQEDTTKKVGAFDALDGFWFQQDDDASSTLQFCMRTSVSGGAVDTAVDQDDWNVDSLDGTGQSGKTLDITDVQQMFIKLGGQAGYVEFGFFIDGEMCVAHRLYVGNGRATPMASWLSLPLAALIFNDDTVADTDQLYMFSWSAGGYGDIKRTAVRVSIATACDRPKSLPAAGDISAYAMRPKNGSNYELGALVPKGGALMAEANGAYRWRIVVGASTILTGAWAGATDTDTGRSEWAEDNAALTGGIQVASGFGRGHIQLPEFDMDEMLKAATALTVASDPEAIAIEVTAIDPINLFVGFDALELM